jgi:hypothetical protein
VGEAYTKTEKMSSLIDYSVRNYGLSGNPQTPFDSTVRSTSPVTIVSNSFSGSKNPYWKDQIRAGVDATTSAFGTHTNVHLDPCIVQAGYTIPNTAHPNLNDFRATILSGVLQHDAPPGMSAPGSTVTSVYNHAIRNFINACLEARQAILAGQDFGEWRETLHGIVSPLSSLRKYTLSYFPTLKKRLRGVKRLPLARKALADTYLEWSFGWKPLAEDVGSAIVAHQNADRHFETAPVYGAGHDTYQGSSIAWRPLTNGAIDLLGTQTDTGLYYVRFKGAIRTGAVGGTIPTSQLYGLDLPYFIPTLWELLPYSWIADYFVNIGNYLQARAFRYADLTYCVKTVRDTAKRQFALTKNAFVLSTGAVWSFNSVSGGNSYLERTQFQRTAATPQDLIPRIQFTVPFGRNKPWENMGALLLQKAEGVYPILRGLSIQRKIARL